MVKAKAGFGLLESNRFIDIGIYFAMTEPAE
jgi:hypothetical protein